MHGLEVPLEFPGSGVERDNGISEEVVALAIEPVIVAGGTSEHGVQKAALGVQGHIEAPVVDACAILPTLRRPRVVAGFTSLRNGMKFPNLCAGACVIRACVARGPVAGCSPTLAPINTRVLKTVGREL